MNMLSKVLLSSTFVISFAGVTSVARAQSSCVTVLNHVTSDVQWRDDITNRNSSGGFTFTSKAREKEIRKELKEMKKDTVEDSTPIMGIHVPDDAIHDMKWTDGYGTHTITKMEITGLGPKGELPMTLLLPVSGHTGKENALKWAKTDTYSILLKDSSGGSQYLVRDAKSLDLVTVQELVVPLQKGQTMRLEYHRSGSLGPGGYVEGRSLDLVWDGK